MTDWMRFVLACAQKNRLHDFYTCSAWLRLRRRILIKDNNECQACKKKGIYTRATHVHHVKYVRMYPELALSETYTDQQGNERRNLISVCHACHEAIHAYRQREKKAPLTDERW